MIEEIENYNKEISRLIYSYVTVGFTQPSIRSYIERGEKLTPSILSQFPPSEPLPDSIMQFCFPWGTDVISDINQGIKSLESQYNFIITNDDGSSLYCSCVKTYLPVFEGPGLIQRPKTRRMSIKTSDPLDLPSFDTNYYSTTRSRNAMSSIGFSAGNSPKEISSLLVPKCILLVSKAPFLDTLLNILKDLLKISASPLLLPIECYVAHLVLQIPYPPRGMHRISYQLGARSFSFAFPEPNQLPLLDTNIAALFCCLDLKNVLILFRHISIEQSVVFLSSNENNLTTCSYALLSFLFPLKWSLLYVPILPEKLIDYLYSPVAFVFGMHSKYRDSVYARCNGSVLIVDLDRNKIEMNLQAVKISQQTRSVAGNNLPSLPVHYGAKLKKRLKAVLKKTVVGPVVKLVSPKLDEASCEKIRDIFFQFFISILQGYGKCLNDRWKDNPNQVIFEHDRFIISFRERNCKYMYKITRTQMFANFCQSRLRPKSAEEHMENLLFDDSIQAKLNRSKLRYTKKPTKFIEESQHVYKQDHSVIKIYNCYKSQGQIQYNIYPDFSLEVLAGFGLPYPKPPQFTSILDTATVPSLESAIICESDLDFIYCSWIEMWAATLWYQHEGEQNQRLRELTRVLEAINNTCKFSAGILYKLLLESCMSVSPSLALPIFSVMSRSSVLINTEIIKLLRKIISKLFVAASGSSTDQSWLFTNSESISPTLSVRFKKRVFIEANNSSKQEVSFVLQDFCRNCERELTVEDIKLGWKNMGDEIYCGCGAQITPNLRVKIQTDSIGHNRFTTESVKFLNPRGMKGVLDELLSENENIFHLDIEAMRLVNPFVFWNLIWHFYKADLPYEFFMPYERELSPSNYININYEEINLTTWDEKECQTEWDFASLEESLKKYYEVIQEE